MQLYPLHFNYVIRKVLKPKEICNGPCIFILGKTSKGGRWSLHIQEFILINSCKWMEVLLWLWLSCIVLGHCDWNVTAKRRALNGPAWLRHRKNFSPFGHIYIFLAWGKLWVLCGERCSNPPQDFRILEVISNLNDSVILWSVLQDLRKKWHPGKWGAAPVLQEFIIPGQRLEKWQKQEPFCPQVLKTCTIYILHGAEVGSVPGFPPSCASALVA